MATPKGHHLDSFAPSDLALLFSSYLYQPEQFSTTAPTLSMKGILHCGTAYMVTPKGHLLESFVTWACGPDQ